MGGVKFVVVLQLCLSLDKTGEYSWGVGFGTVFVNVTCSYTRTK